MILVESPPAKYIQKYTEKRHPKDSFRIRLLETCLCDEPNLSLKQNGKEISLTCMICNKQIARLDVIGNYRIRPIDISTFIKLARGKLKNAKG